MHTHERDVRRQGPGAVSAVFGGPFRMLLLLLCIVCAGCGPSLRAVFTVYHTLPDEPARTSYAFAPLKDQTSGMENAACRSAIRTALLRHRYIETDMAGAKQLVSFNYRLVKGQERTDGSLRERIDAAKSHLEIKVFISEKGKNTGKAAETLYEGEVQSSGEAPLLEKAVPAMIDELFLDFPGRSRTKRIVHIRLPRESGARRAE